jgi:hypothetical protein
MKHEPPKGPVINRKRVSKNCQEYFRSVGQELDNHYKPSWVNDFPGKNADGIAKLISEDAHGERKHWDTLEHVGHFDPGASPEEIYWKAQGLANQGVIVIGAMPKDDSGYGHLGFVVPIREGLDASLFDGEGPFVRDGNEHLRGGRLFASSWGAVRASNAFKLSMTHWYVWVPSEK